MEHNEQLLITLKKHSKKNHSILSGYMHLHGKKFPKKHGNWIRLNLNDDWFLEMDSWNGYIKLKQGSGDPKNIPTNHLFNDVCGFNGKEWLFVGRKNIYNHDNYPYAIQIYAMINRVKSFLKIK